MCALALPLSCAETPGAGTSVPISRRTRTIHRGTTAVQLGGVGAKVAAETVYPALRDGRGSLLFTGGGLALQPSAQYASAASISRA